MRLPLLLVIPLLNFAPTAFSESVKQYEVRDFFRNPARSDFSLSPDGKRLSFMQPYQQRLNIYVQQLDAKGKPLGEPKRLTSETARDIQPYGWKGNEHLLYVKDFGGDENFHVVSVAVDGSGIKDLTPYEKIKASVVDDLKDDAEHVLLQYNQRDKNVFDVYRVSVTTGEAALIAQNPGNVTDWLTDHAGRLRVGVASDGVNTSLLYRDDESAKFRTLLTTWKTERKFVDAVTEQRYASIAKQLPGCEIEPQSWSKDETKWVVIAYNDRMSPAFYLFDATSGSLTKLSESTGQPVEADMAVMKPIQYPARDGLIRKKTYEMIGDPVADKQLLRAVSPVYHVDRIKTPLLVAQGANDPRVKKAESDQIVAALRKRGVSVQYLLKENEGHGFANEENRIEFYETMTKFLAQHVPANAGDTPRN